MVVGLALFLKLAVEQGWLRLSPAARCAGVAVAGLAFLGVGEWMLRRLSRAASAGFSAAGVGTLMASVWAAHRLYDLTGPTIAFVLMTAACALGVAVAARSRLASVAIVAIIGAYLNPLVVGDASKTLAGFFTYLLMVLVTGLVLPAWKGRPFFPVRGVVWWGTLLVGGLPAAGLIRGGTAITPLLFTTIAWALIQAELAISSVRRVRSSSDPADGLALLGPGSLAWAHITLPWRRWRPVAMSFIVTAWTALLATRATDSVMPGWGWLAPAMLAALLLGAAHVLAGHHRFLHDIPRTPRDRLGAAMAVQAAALFVVAVALALSGGAAVVGWLVMGVASIAAGRWLKARPLDVYGLVLLLIGTTRLALYESILGVGRGASAGALGLTWTLWTVLALCAAMAWTAAARLLRQSNSRPWTVVSNVAVAIGLTAAGMSPALGARAFSVCTLISLTAAGVILIGQRLRSRGLAFYGASLLFIATLTAPIAGAWVINGSNVVPFAGLILSPWTAALLVTSAGWLVLRTLRPPGRIGRRLGAASVFAAVLALLLVPLHQNADTASVSVAWLVVGLIAIATSRVSSWRELPLAGAGAMILALTAWLAAFSPLNGRWPADAAPPLGSAGLWLGLLHVAGLSAAAWLARAADAAYPSIQRSLPTLLLAAASVALWVATSMEAGRIGEIISNDPTVQRAAVSVWWGAYGLGLISAGLMVRTRSGRGIPAARRVGLALVAVAVLKAVIWDLAFVSAPARVFSLIGLGLLMMAVTVVYNKLAGRVDASNAVLPADPVHPHADEPSSVR